MRDVRDRALEAALKKAPNQSLMFSELVKALPAEDRKLPGRAQAEMVQRAMQRLFAQGKARRTGAWWTIPPLS